MAELEILREIGDWGLTKAVDFSGAIIQQELGGAYSDGLVVDAETFDWSFNWKVLPGTKDNEITDLGVTKSRADYLWAFFIRRMREGNGSFFLPCPFDGKTYLVAFAEFRLSYEQFMAKLYSTGIKVKLRRDATINTLDDGSIATVPEGEILQ
ncbi:MAG: hypothetical protein ABIZ95_20740 [Pyrinomonadaceae bacterium]